MRGLRTVPACILLMGVLIAAVDAARAEVSPGDVIDKTNWEKVQGLLPDPVLEWVKKGDFVLDIEVPNFELADCFPPFQIRAFETNVGKYELDAKGGIIEAATGKTVEQIVGLPFPKIAEDDPRLAEKLMQNNHYMGFLVGNVRIHFQSVYLNRSGYVREGGLLGMQMPMVGHPGAAKTPNPSCMEKCSLGIIKTPYDAAGAALMTWRYLDPEKQDNSFGYSPAIRRL